jgi:hypothetical protein
MVSTEERSVMSERELNLVLLGGRLVRSRVAGGALRSEPSPYLSLTGGRLRALLKVFHEREALNRS